jgi:hypothetical protein
MAQRWECCTVEWLWDQNAIQCHQPGGREGHWQGSYAQVVDLLTQLGQDGWEVAACAANANWLFWTLKRAAA